jgi:hypothetical protein
MNNKHTCRYSLIFAVLIVDVLLYIHSFRLDVCFFTYQNKLIFKSIFFAVQVKLPFTVQEHDLSLVHILFLFLLVCPSPPVIFSSLPTLPHIPSSLLTIPLPSFSLLTLPLFSSPLLTLRLNPTTLLTLGTGIQLSNKKKKIS